MKIADIAHQRLHNQHISGSKFEKPEDVVSWLVASQAQDFAGAKWALGLRMQNAQDGDIEKAFNDGSILRTHMMRPTWHFVTPTDICWMLALTSARVQAGNASMYRLLELDTALFKRARKSLIKALQGGKQHTREELGTAFEQAGIAAASGQRLAYIIMHAELEGLICSGPRRGRQFTYMLLDERAPRSRDLPKEAALAELTLRYFNSRGPASAQDFAKWSGLTLTDARRGLEAVKTELQHADLDGQSYWLSKSKPSPRAASPIVYLLSVYDEYVSAYKDRSAMDAGYGSQLIGLGNALQFIIVIDGLIVGTWKRTIKKDAVLIDTNLFKRLTRRETQVLATAAGKYAEFLGLPVMLA